MADLCSPKTLARWFISNVDRDAGQSITHLKLQKLLYFAQAYHLANFNRQLFAEDMEAWAHGPVVPSIWREYKDYGWESIPTCDAPTIDDDSLLSYLEAVNEKFGKFEAKELEKITHSHDPWKETRGPLRPEARCSDPIDKKLIRDFYAARIKKTWKSTDKIRH
jgi:uncharacterized phage-associated protein